MLYDWLYEIFSMKGKTKARWLSRIEEMEIGQEKEEEN